MPIAYQLRVELRDFKPAIYRDLWVDPAAPLFACAQVLPSR